MDLIKKDGAWITRREAWSSFDVAPNLNTLPVSGDPGEYAHYYTACMDPFDALENNRKFLSDAADDHKFWVRGFRTREAALAFGFGNTREIRLASASDVVEAGPAQRQPSGRLEDVTAPIVSVDGVTLRAGDSVLIKDQWYETLTTHAFDGAGTKTVSINNVLNDKDELFTEGNEVAFYDADGAEVFRSTITNLELSTISGTPFVVFDVLEDIPDDAVACADLVDGEWTRTTLYEENGVYTATQTVPGELVLVLDDTHTGSQEAMLNLVEWVRDGDTNRDTTWYLQRDADSFYPSNGDDRVFAAARMSLVKFSTSYDATEDTYAYPAVRMKGLVTSIEAARVQAYGSGLVRTAMTSGSGTAEFTFDYSLGVTGLIRDLYSDLLNPPSMVWTLDVSGKVATWDETDDATVQLSAGNITWPGSVTPPDNLAGSGSSSPSDFVRITMWDDDGALALDHVAVVIDYDSGNGVNFYPELPPQAVSDCRALNPYTARVENLSIYENLADLGQAISNTPVGQFYRIVRETDSIFLKNVPMTGFARDIDLSDGTRISLRGQSDPDENGDYDVAVADGTYTLTDAYVSTPTLDNDTDIYLEQEGRHYVDCATDIYTTAGTTSIGYAEEVYNPSYTIGGMLRQMNPPATTTAFDAATDLGSTTRTYQYSNVAGDDRFGFVRNTLYIGPDYDASWYLVGTFLRIHVDESGNDLDRRVVAIETDGDYTVIRLNEVIDPSEAPSSGTDVTVRERFEVGEIDEDLASYSGNVEAYNRMLTARASINTYVAAIFTEGDMGALALFKDAPTLSTDPRLYYAPSALLHVGTDGELGETLFVGDDDWYIDDDGKLHIEPGEDSGRIRFIDGLKEKRIRDPKDPQNVYSWILKDNVVVTGAVVGCTKDSGPGTGTLVWYKGDWRRGTWEDGIWLSGTWRGGVWTKGTWKSVLVIDNGGQNVSYVASNTKNTYSRWIAGVWLDGTWEGGTFTGGTWTKGTWKNGALTGGSWASGTWENGTFEDATWLDGTWLGGDFKFGTWVTGTFDQVIATSRFGTHATATDKAIWEGGTFNGGQFHSGLNAPSGFPLVSTNHEYSLWWSGTWNGGDWYGGTFVYGTWNASVSRPSTWHGGVWIGGYPITSIADRNTVSKTVTVDITPTWATITGDTCPGHGVRTGQRIAILAEPSSTVTDLHKQLFVNVAMDNGSYGTVASRPALPPTLLRSVVGTSGALVLYVTSPDISITGTTYHAESSSRRSGQPYLASVWNGGTWMGGVWMGGIFNGGSFEAGLWCGGLMSYGRVGYLP